MPLSYYYSENSSRFFSRVVPVEWVFLFSVLPSFKYFLIDHAKKVMHKYCILHHEQTIHCTEMIETNTKYKAEVQNDTTKVAGFEEPHNL